MKLEILISIVSLLIFKFAVTQTVENVKFEQRNNFIIINYDLQDISSKYTTLFVNVYYSIDNGGSWLGPITSVSGDVFYDVKGGYNKKIIWDVLAEREDLIGNIIFKVAVDVLFDTKMNQNQVIASGLELVFVEGGYFLMGSQDDEKFRAMNEMQHSVYVTSFLISKFEITQLLYDDIIIENNLNFTPDSAYIGLPVCSINWYDAIEFCNMLSLKLGLDPFYIIHNKRNIDVNLLSNGFRLPTEKEWEYAARGGKLSKNYIYSGGNDLSV